MVMVNTFDIRGGAARASRRLHQGFQRIGLRPVFLTLEKFSDDPSVHSVAPAKNALSEKMHRTFKNITLNYLRRNASESSTGRFSLGYPGYDIARLPVIQNADIINLHWVSDFLSAESVASLLQLGKPVLWTLHDENPYTGGCHYSGECMRFKGECGICPQLSRDPHRLAYHTLENKRRLWSGAGFHTAAPSRWLADRAGASRIFADGVNEVIANAIETDIFSPVNKKEAKRALGIDEDVATILTAISGRTPRRKGFSEFLAALKHCSKSEAFQRLASRRRLLLLSFETPAPEMDELGIPHKSFGKIESDPLLAQIYNAADMMVLPSLQDNLPNTMLEAMACGAPVLAFSTGGMRETIEHNVTGKLIPPGNTEQFGEEILDMLFHRQKAREMGAQARKRMEEKYIPELQAQKYLDYFRVCISGQRPAPTFSGGADVPPVSIPPDAADREQWACFPDLSFNPALQGLYDEYMPREKYGWRKWLRWLPGYVEG